VAETKSRADRKIGRDTGNTEAKEEEVKMYVYFIQAFGERSLVRIKIGKSRNPEARLSQLQVGSAVKLKLLGKVKCRDESHACSIEKFAHNIFHKQRKHGEWFNLSAKHIQQIKNLIEKAAARETELV
jgi:hypothetical protein